MNFHLSGSFLLCFQTYVQTPSSSWPYKNLLKCIMLHRILNQCRGNQTVYLDFLWIHNDSFFHPYNKWIQSFLDHKVESNQIRVTNHFLNSMAKLSVKMPLLRLFFHLSSNYFLIHHRNTYFHIYIWSNKLGFTFLHKLHTSLWSQQEANNLKFNRDCFLSHLFSENKAFSIQIEPFTQLHAKYFFAFQPFFFQESAS